MGVADGFGVAVPAVEFKAGVPVRVGAGDGVVVRTVGLGVGVAVSAGAAERFLRV